MVSSIKVAPPNSLLFISDQGGGETPEIARGDSIWSTPSCVVVGCLTFADGQTEVTLGGAREVAPKRNLMFDGSLETPSKAVVVSVVGGQAILKEIVSGPNTRVRVWTNRPSEPDEVVIGLD